MGSDPGAIALSDDNSHLFAALSGAPMVVPVDLALGRALDPYILTGPLQVYDSPYQTLYFSPYQMAIGIVPVSGNPSGVVVCHTGSEDVIGNTPETVAVYDKGGRRPSVIAASVAQILPGDDPGAIYVRSGIRQYPSTIERLVVTTAGVISNGSLDPQGLTGNLLVSSNRILYTSDGSIWAADTLTFLGSVASGGYPIPLRDRNQVVYVGFIGSGKMSVITFGLDKFIPIAATVIGVSGTRLIAAARAGDGAISFATDTETVIVPLASLTLLPPLTATLTSVAKGVALSSLPALAIAARPGTSNLLVSTPSVAANYGNSLLTMDTSSGGVVQATYIGSEPSAIAVTPDGNVAYSLIPGGQMIARVNLAKGTQDLLYSARYPGENAATGVTNMTVGPDSGLAINYDSGAVAIFDADVIRPQIDLDQDPSMMTGSTGLVFGDSSTRLYGYLNSLKRYTVSSSGVVAISLSNIAGPYLPGVSDQYGSELALGAYSGGLLYTSTGIVVDPETAKVVYVIPNIPRALKFLFGPYSHRVAVDPGAERLYILAANQLLIFDLYSYTPLGSLHLPYDDFDFPLNLVRFGPDGLAINTYSGRLVLVSISAAL